MTTDLWTEEYTNETFICATAHFIDEKWSLKCHTIFLKLFPYEDKTGVNIRVFLEQELTKGGILPDHLRSIRFVTDRGI